MSKLTNVLLLGGAMAGVYVAGKCAGITDCVSSANKILEKDYKLTITNAVARPLKRGMVIAISKLKEES